MKLVESARALLPRRAPAPKHGSPVSVIALCSDAMFLSGNIAFIQTDKPITPQENSGTT